MFDEEYIGSLDTDQRFELFASLADTCFTESGRKMLLFNPNTPMRGEDAIFDDGVQELYHTYKQMRILLPEGFKLGYSISCRFDEPPRLYVNGFEYVFGSRDS